MWEMAIICENEIVIKSNLTSFNTLRCKHLVFRFSPFSTHNRKLMILMSVIVVAGRGECWSQLRHSGTGEWSP